VTASLTDYPDSDTDNFVFSFTAEDPCADASATTITINEALVDAAWTNTDISIYTSEDYVFDTTNWASSSTTGPTGTVDCGALAVFYTLTTDGAAYLTTSSNTATVDFASTTSAVGGWTLNIEVQAAAYTGVSDPSDTYAFALTAFDPCDDADAVTLGTAYIATFDGDTYDLFDGPDSYTWDAS